MPIDNQTRIVCRNKEQWNYCLELFESEGYEWNGTELLFLRDRTPGITYAKGYREVFYVEDDLLRHSSVGCLESRGMNRKYGDWGLIEAWKLMPKPDRITAPKLPDI